jgi:hypothetical protein
MSGQSFAFPPPPPPPPKRSSEQTDAASRGRGFSSGIRGRGGNHRGRGFGSSHARGRGWCAQQARSQQWSGANYSNNSHTQDYVTATRGSQHWNTTGQHKRDHSTAFDGDALRKSRPSAAPAVPSFSANLAHLLPTKPGPRAHASAAPTEHRKNALGLTPASADQSASEDDEEEEKKLGGGGAQDLQFEYRGQTASLRTPEEIAAWIAERKRRYPTQAKRDAAQKEAQEKRRQWEAQKQARSEAARLARESRQQRHKRVDVPPSGQRKTQTSVSHKETATAAKLQAERLRRKAIRVQRDLAAAEARLAKHETSSVSAPDGTAQLSSDDSLGTLSDSSVLSSDVGSSGSESDSEDDGPPEAQSSKTEVASAFTGIQAESRASKRPCKTFAKTGTCQYGARCHFSHDGSVGAGSSARNQTQPKRARKGLFEAMVEREREDERRKLLAAIIALGKQGVLEPQ